VPEFEFGGVRPRIHPDAFVAPTAVLIGDVEIESGASIWFGVVIRGDHSLIRIGSGSNVQDNSVIHSGHEIPTVIGAGVTIGHGAVLDGCLVGDGAVVGVGAIALQRSRIGASAMLAAGSLLAEGAEVPPGYLAAGSPAQVKKALSGAAADWVGRAAQHYIELAAAYRTLTPPRNRTRTQSARTRG
jgi:carbonic anhydrase/acetyltransferase-like protein (isoleucine patch superfamily)